MTRHGKPTEIAEIIYPRERHTHNIYGNDTGEYLGPGMIRDDYNHALNIASGGYKKFIPYTFQY